MLLCAGDAEGKTKAWLASKELEQDRMKGLRKKETKKSSSKGMRWGGGND